MPESRTFSSSPVVVPETVQAVDLRCFSYAERRSVLPALLDALDLCGCWMEGKRALSASQMELRFETQLCAADDLYSALIAAGVELTREAHAAMTWLCTLSRHEDDVYSSFRTVNVRMEMEFLDETDLAYGTVQTCNA